MRFIKMFCWGLLVFLGVFTTMAFAAGAATPEDGSLLDYLKPVLEAFRGGDYPFTASLAVVFIVAAARRYGSPRIPWLGSRAGGAALTFAGAFAGGLATGLSGDGTFSWHLALMSLNVAFVATGGYVIVKELFIDKIIASKWYQEKAPGWLKSILSLVLWMFEHRGKSASDKAEEAGDKAVAADPAKGHGEITELK